VPEGPDSLGIAGEGPCRLLTDTAGLGAIRLGLGSGIGLLPKGHLALPRPRRPRKGALPLLVVGVAQTGESVRAD